MMHALEHPHSRARYAASQRANGPRSFRTVTLLFAWLLALTLMFVLVPTAESCPRCAIGEEARTRVWNDDFGVNLAIALAPFLVIGAVCVSVESIGRRRS
jgi:hypothetical protein